MNLIFYSFSLLLVFQVIILLLYLIVKAEAIKWWAAILLLTIIGMEYSNIMINDLLLKNKLVALNYLLDFLLGPALFFSIKKLSGAKIKLKRTELLHLLPFLLFVSLSLMNWVSIRELRSDYHEFLPILSLFIYTICSFIWLTRKKSHVSEKKHHKTTLLKGILICFLINVGLAFISVILFLRGYQGMVMPLNLGILVIDFTWASGISIMLVFKGHLISSDTPKRKRIPVNSDKIEEYKLLFAKSEQIISDNKLYCNPKISLPLLAETIGCSTHDLSAAINMIGDKNFFEWINQFRLEEAISLLKQSKENNLRINEIMYQVGFNSRSSFNTAFKKHTGLTPSQFKSQNILQ